jgi:hypothetical protein
MFVSLHFKLELKKEDKEKLIEPTHKLSSAVLRELEKEKTKKPHERVKS